jgi:hypothetical protein
MVWWGSWVAYRLPDKVYFFFLRMTALIASVFIYTSVSIPVLLQRIQLVLRRDLLQRDLGLTE